MLPGLPSALILYPYQGHVSAEFPQINKKIQTSLVLLFITCIMAKGPYLLLLTLDFTPVEPEGTRFLF